jgi:hypothetical protein
MPRGRPRRTDDALLKSSEVIGWALGGLEREIVLTRERLSALMAQATTLRKRLGRKASSITSLSVTQPIASKERLVRKRGEMSVEAKKRISEMMKKRWAERKKRGLKRL